MISKFEDKIIDSLEYSELPSDEKLIWDAIGEGNYKLLKKACAGATLHISCVFSHRKQFRETLERELENYNIVTIANRLYTTPAALRRILREEVS
jgi:hypothetical protein